jgi:hypothetical protein
MGNPAGELKKKREKRRKKHEVRVINKMIAEAEKTEKK